MKRTPRGCDGGRGELLFCSLGFSPERTATLQALEALRRCDIVFCGERPPRMLRLFCADCRPLPARGAVRAILAAARGRAVGYAAFGQPMVFGPLARELARGARESGIRVSVLGGLSAFDSFLTSSREVFGYAFGWYQVLEDCRPEALALTGPLDRGLPCVAFLKAGSTRVVWESLIARLRGSYPASRGCAVFDVSAQGNRRHLRRCRVDELSVSLARRSDSSFVVILPEGHDSR